MVFNSFLLSQLIWEKIQTKFCMVDIFDKFWYIFYSGIIFQNVDLTR